MDYSHLNLGGQLTIQTTVLKSSANEFSIGHLRWVIPSQYNLHRYGPLTFDSHNLNFASQCQVN
jgi:hypothetical protein